MTTAGAAVIVGVAADAALRVPGVTGLPARLARRLAAAAVPARTYTMSHRAPPEAGIRAERACDGSGWKVEVRCALAEGRRPLDVARDVHDRVRTALVSRLAAAEPVTVTVTVTRVAARDGRG
ncbi:hypothetical protein [Streptomyces sp. NPDC101237]|uniref:hypothetical protein n=1 Tax=Streptomyces sp. NPDC101237 TaxID=3366139 RepID=UPI003807662D